MGGHRLPTEDRRAERVTMQHPHLAERCCCTLEYKSLGPSSLLSSM